MENEHFERTHHKNVDCINMANYYRKELTEKINNPSQIKFIMNVNHKSYELIEGTFIVIDVTGIPQLFQNMNQAMQYKNRLVRLRRRNDECNEYNECISMLAK